KQAQVFGLIVINNQVKGVITDSQEAITSHCVIIATGTFLEGLIHIGLKNFPGGRIGESASVGLAQDLNKHGLKLLRFKTGTCPRLDKKTIDFSKLIVQDGDVPPSPFSFSTQKITQKQIPCHITYTNKETHKIILDNLDKSPLYAGIIKATGVRYCPSVEDKIVKFPDRERHQVFLEPQGYDTDEIYPNGLSTSLPEEVQLKILHSIAGLEQVKVIRFGYGIEHDVVDPTQIYPTLETKLIKNLYLAGQINGTTGYEEAAAQGLVAGINASLNLRKKMPMVLSRASGYIGVLIDDLVTKGTNEPYRMFTSRVEYRLLLREDNADLRLRKIGYEVGLVTKDEYKKTEDKIESMKKGLVFLKKHHLNPAPGVNKKLTDFKTVPLKKKTSLEELLRRPQVDWRMLEEIFPLDIPDDVIRQLEIEVKYSGFIQRQLAEVDKFNNLEKIKIPEGLDYNDVSGISREIKEKLIAFKPINLGQALRISGVTPAAVSLLMVYLRKKHFDPN
ncbi:tRNA uridine-5-carboxymethylaminomethyl(34) synthesis enzyme MnmG, partial [bacterium]